jgi:mRNA interferase RelE/StbE
VESDDRYDVAFSAGAQRDIEFHLKESVATAALELIYGDLSLKPRIVGKPLKYELTGQWSAVRGSYRIHYEIDEDAHRLWILRVKPRGKAYVKR